jgi:hypothetical protein
MIRLLIALGFLSKRASLSTRCLCATLRAFQLRRR